MLTDIDNQTLNRKPNVRKNVKVEESTDVR